MNILDKIIATKREEVARRKVLAPTRQLESSVYFQHPCHSLKKQLTAPASSGVIAEFKRQSPSKGTINDTATVERTTTGYMQAGASALSVLTDTVYFGGSNEDLKSARWVNSGPILRKEFIIDEYQLIEAKSIGADVILLIAECLTAKEVKSLAAMAKSIGLEVLMEVHSAEQLEKWTPDIDQIGVNNRDLKVFAVDIQRSLEILPLLPNEVAKVSESGLRTPEDVAQLKQAGFDGFLIGEHFMRAQNPGAACAAFIQAVSDQLNQPNYANA